MNDHIFKKDSEIWVDKTIDFISHFQPLKMA